MTTTTAMGRSSSIMCVTAVLMFIQLSTCFITATKIDSKELEKKVDKFIADGMSCHNNPGMSLSVVHDGEVLLAKGYGYKSTDRLEPVTNSTLFGIASLTKAFAATLLLKLIEDSDNISLSTTVCKILGNDNCFYDDLRSRYSTLEDLMAHRMGIPSNNNIRLDDTLTRKTLTERIRYLKSVGGFRTSFYYSNLMYGIITYIAELLGGATWEELVQTKLFDRLGMTSSAFTTTADFQTLDLALGYQDRDGELLPVPHEFSRHWGDLCGSGCILSNSVDIASWMLFNLNAGRNKQNEKVVAASSLAHAHKAQNSISSSTAAKYYTRPLTPVSLSNDNYGLGWKLGYYRGYPILTHTGSTYGYRSMLTMLQGLNMGIYIAMTGDDPSYIFRTNIHLYIADLLTGHDPWLNSSTLCSFPEPWKPKREKKPRTVNRDIQPKRPLPEYVGVYRNDGYGEIEFYLNDTNKYLMARYGFGQLVLYPKTSADQFYGEGFGLLKNIIDYSSIKFQSVKVKNDGPTILSSVTIPSFETKLPPVFTRTVNKQPLDRLKSNTANFSVHNNAWSPLTIFTMIHMAYHAFGYKQ